MVRVGIVGATVTVGGSGWGANAHVPALRALPEYRLAAVCTAHEATARASAAAFGAERAFADFDQMLADPEIDLVSVVVRAPEHRTLTLKALHARKATFCEWPLGANLAEAEEMTALTRSLGVPTFVGLQARSDPAVRFARELIDEGYVGQAIVANLTVSNTGVYRRGAGRIWQAHRVNGANPLTIAGGHSIDVARYLLGALVDVSARVTTQTREWFDTDTGQLVAVDAPDTVNVVARTESGAELAVQIATVPTGAAGFRFEIYGTAGRLVLTAGNVNTGPSQLSGAKANDALAELHPPHRDAVVVESRSAQNVARAYARFAATAAGRPFDPDFETALTLHRLIDAIERSSAMQTTR